MASTAQPLAESFFCERCGEEFEPKHRVCAGCGAVPTRQWFQLMSLASLLAAVACNSAVGWLVLPRLAHANGLRFLAAASLIGLRWSRRLRECRESSACEPAIREKLAGGVIENGETIVRCTAKVEETSVSVAAREGAETLEAFVGLLGQRIESVELPGYGVENTYKL